MEYWERQEQERKLQSMNISIHENRRENERQRLRINKLEEEATRADETEELFDRLCILEKQVAAIQETLDSFKIPVWRNKK